MNKHIRLSIKIILLATVLFLSNAAYGHSQTVKASVVTELNHNLRVESNLPEGELLRGFADETQAYDRALSSDEIPAISEDGCEGDCKVEEETAGTIGTQIAITGPDFGDKKGKVAVGGKSCKVLQWAADSITCEVRAKLPAGIYDVMVQPREPKDAEPIIYEKAFTMMAPEILSVDPGFAPTREIEVFGTFFGTRKGRVYLLDAATGRRKICKITKIEWYNNETEIREKPCRVKEWTMDPATGTSKLTFTVFKRLRAGTYGLEIVNKAGGTSALFTVNDD